MPEENALARAMTKSVSPVRANGQSIHARENTRRVVVFALPSPRELATARRGLSFLKGLSFFASGEGRAFGVTPTPKRTEGCHVLASRARTQRVVVLGISRTTHRKHKEGRRFCVARTRKHAEGCRFCIITDRKHAEGRRFCVAKMRKHAESCRFASQAKMSGAHTRGPAERTLEASPDTLPLRARLLQQILRTRVQCFPTQRSGS